MNQLPKLEEFLVWLSGSFTEARIEFSTFMLPASIPTYPHILIRPESIKSEQISFGGGDTETLSILFHICSIRADYQEAMRIANLIEGLINFKTITTDFYIYTILFPIISFVYEEEVLQKMILEYSVVIDNRVSDQFSTVNTASTSTIAKEIPDAF